jgi:hypothetical protein
LISVTFQWSTHGPSGRDGRQRSGSFLGAAIPVESFDGWQDPAPVRARIGRVVPFSMILGMLLFPALTAASERSTASSTAAPKIILAQAGSTGGTIAKEGKSVSGSEEQRLSSGARPARKSQQTATARQTKKTGGTSVVGHCGNIVGAWTWHGLTPQGGPPALPGWQ